MKTIIKWVVVLSMAAVIYVIIVKAMAMVINGEEAGTSILVVISALAAAQVYEEFSRALSKPQNRPPNELDERKV